MTPACNELLFLTFFFITTAIFYLLPEEKNIMAALHHPLLANLVDSYQDDQFVYMLMGLVQGGELQSVIHDYQKGRHGLAEADAKFFAAGIQEGLAFLHRRGYVYRDLKPENVLVSDVSTKDVHSVLIGLHSSTHAILLCHHE
jgi:serine/threonine protein kinase